MDVGLQINMVQTPEVFYFCILKGCISYTRENKILAVAHGYDSEGTCLERRIQSLAQQ